MPGGRERSRASNPRASGACLRGAVRAVRVVAVTGGAVTDADGTLMPVEAAFRAVLRRGVVLSGRRSGAGSRVQNCSASDKE
ncbi:MAG TPA: hypothetical protein VND68_13500 [Chloroflexia bacterium]|nr:hypothetical protein [Chloroflexia bacterium]